MNEQEIKQRNLKITIFKEFPAKRINELCEAMEKLGFDVKFIEEGRIICTDMKD